MSSTIPSPAPWAGAAAGAVGGAVRGPIMSRAPALAAAAAALAAPAAVPPVSRTSSDGEPGALSASCAACTRALPRSALGPLSGARIATAPPAPVAGSPATPGTRVDGAPLPP